MMFCCESMVCFTLRVKYTVLLEGIVCLAMEMVRFAFETMMQHGFAM